VYLYEFVGNAEVLDERINAMELSSEVCNGNCQQVNINERVCAAIDYGLGDQGSIPGKAGYFSLLYYGQTGSGAHQAPIQWVQGALSQVVKWPECEANHSHQAGRSKMVEQYLHSPISFHGIVLD
jgi:hypothetical protein